MNNIVIKTIQVHIARWDNSTNVFQYLVLRRNENETLYPGIWQVVTGTIEPNENSMLTAVREVKEETNLDVSELFAVPYITKFYDSKLDAIQFAPVFGVIVSENAKVEISDEHHEYKWVGINECIDLLALPGHKEGTFIFQDYILNSNNKNLFLKTIPKQ